MKGKSGLVILSRIDLAAVTFNDPFNDYQAQAIPFKLAGKAFKGCKKSGQLTGVHADYLIY